MPVANGLTVEPRLLDEASDWLMRLHDSALTDAERADFERWRKSSPAHTQAWARAERLMGKLGDLPAALAMPALDRPKRYDRRAVLAKLAALLAVAPAGWLGWHLAREQGWNADLCTATGEQRTSILADGSRVLLDTGTAVDIKFDSSQRLIKLRKGAIFIETAKESGVAFRPFIVATSLGRLRALGTRFSMRLDDDAQSLLLAVSEGAVEVTLRGASSSAMVVRAGQQVTLTGQEAGPPRPAAPQDQAWVHGMLMADAMPLINVCAQLSRYRPGILRCAPEVAQVRISGAYPLMDTDRALAMLASTYAVRVNSRWQGYLVTVSAR